MATLLDVFCSRTRAYKQEGRGVKERLSNKLGAAAAGRNGRRVASIATLSLAFAHTRHRALQVEIEDDPAGDKRDVPENELLKRV